MAYGQGSVTKRSDGRFMARYRFHGADGLQTITAYSRVSEKVALDKLRVKVQLAEGAGVRVDETTTMAAFLTTWMKQQKAEVEAGNLKQNTYRQREYITRTVLIPRLGHHKVRTLRPSDISTLRNNLLREPTVKTGEPMRPQSVVHVIRTLHRAMEVAVADGVVQRNPAAHVDMPKVRREAPNVLTAEQTRCLLDHLSTTRYGAAFALAAGTGLRVGEVLALTESDLVLPETGNGLVMVRQNWTRTPEGWGLTAPKTARGIREVPVPEQIVPMLREHIATVQAERETSAGAWPDDGAVFVREDGLRPEANRLNVLWRRARQACGLPEWAKGPHTLRHGFVTALLKANLSPAIVGRLAGHASSVSIDSYLSKVSPEDAASAEVLGRLLKG